MVEPGAALRGTLRVPGDKSISHRYAMLAALADGDSTISNYAPGDDCASTLRCLAALGVRIESGPQLDATHASPADDEARPLSVTVRGRGTEALREPAHALDCGNSGSTMRMLSGLAAAHPFCTTLAGDASLSRRPMGRVAGPLSRMGARIELGADERPPITIWGGALTSFTFTPVLPSAQVKSAVLLAGLQARGETVVIESVPTRDHTERALAAFGARVTRGADRTAVTGGQRLHAQRLRVPGDLSSAAFPLAAAAGLPGSEVRVEGVGLNPTRTHLLTLLERWGARVRVDPDGIEHGEPTGAITVQAGPLGILTVRPPEVAWIIDELPVLAAVASAAGELHVTGAGELRVKESDRIAALVAGLQALGADATELPDGFHVRGRPIRGGTVHARGDHRLAMAFAVAALGASGPTLIQGADAVSVSYPAFFNDLQRLRA